jgi:hypothetical protein
MGEFSRMTHHIYCIGLRDDLPSLNAQVIAQFHRFMYIFNLCMLVGQLCLKTVSTCLRGRVMGGVTPRTPRRPGVMRMTLISSLSY